MRRTVDLDRQHLDLVENIPVKPFFVMGDHRTGTTVLYKILGATGCFNIVTAYHIISYQEILHNYVNQSVDKRKRQLRALFEERGLTDRGIDRLHLGPDMPEEYGFILPNTGFRLWLKPDNLPTLIELCKKIQYTSDPTRSLLLKNPWDFFLNFMFVKEMFPDSKFIFVHRHPTWTINSQIRGLRNVLSTRNEYIALFAEWYRQLFHQPLRLRMARLLFSSHLDLGLRITTRHVSRGTAYFLKHVSSLPKNDYVCVDYESLCADPSVTVKKILDAFGLEPKADVNYESFIKKRNSPLLAEVERKQEWIFARMKPYFDYGGYDPEVNSS